MQKRLFEMSTLGLILRENMDCYSTLLGGKKHPKVLLNIRAPYVFHHHQLPLYCSTTCHGKILLAAPQQFSVPANLSIISYKEQVATLLLISLFPDCFMAVLESTKFTLWNPCHHNHQITTCMLHFLPLFALSRPGQGYETAGSLASLMTFFASILWASKYTTSVGPLLLTCLLLQKSLTGFRSIPFPYQNHVIFSTLYLIHCASTNAALNYQLFIFFFLKQQTKVNKWKKDTSRKLWK